MLKLRIDWNLTKLPDLNQTGPFSETDGEDIAKPVSQALKVKACTVCQLQMKVIDSTSRHPLPDLDYWLTVSTNTDCQYEWLHENIDNAIQRVIKVSLNRGPIFFRLQYEHRVLSELPGAHDFLYFRRWTFCMFSVIPKVKFCPGIRLLNSEVESLKNQRAKRLLAPFFDAVHANDTDTAFICLADYFRIMEQTNTAQRIKVVWLALVLILLQICACC